MASVIMAPSDMTFPIPFCQIRMTENCYGRKQSGGYLDGAAPDGLLGLGPRSILVPRLLAKAGLYWLTVESVVLEYPLLFWTSNSNT
ncbi:hypothetical protein RIF29_15257 [Crotalaria pallida]|uniref:Uncharacterized protein n=1 Tax=Crotalaria pallida TaxID=3830 RepID=A0AAN9IB16_CROPI